MRSAARIVRESRAAAGLTQAELARRMGTTQSAVARLEAEGANPRVETLRTAVIACGRHLEIDAPAYPSGNIDATLTARHVRMTPAERLRAFEHAYGQFRQLAQAGACARGEMA